MTRLPEGSLVVVSGANGYIGSHVVDQLLKAGFKVRGTVREAKKADWVKEYVESTYGPGKFEAVVVPEIGADGAFDEAVKGASGFMHTASDMSFGVDPEKVITPVVKGIESALDSCKKEPGMKHFVYTSSSSACAMPKPNEKFTVYEDTWNDESVKLAYEDCGPMKPMHVYGASKTLAEQALWKYQKEQHPHFTCNAVVPNMNMGLILAPGKSWDSSGSFAPTLANHGLDALSQYKGLLPQYHIDVQDTARLHVAPLLNSDIRSERIFAYASPLNWNEFLAIIRKLRPEKEVAGTPDNDDKDLSIIAPAPKAEEILRKDFGRPGFTSLEESIGNNLAHLA